MIFLVRLRHYVRSNTTHYCLVCQWQNIRKYWSNSSISGPFSDLSPNNTAIKLN